jgi:hypothetical protein
MINLILPYLCLIPKKHEPRYQRLPTEDPDKEILAQNTKILEAFKLIQPAPTTSLYERIKQYKENEKTEAERQSRIKESANTYAAKEMKIINNLIAQDKERYIYENSIDARTKANIKSQNSNYLMNKEIGDFTKRVIKQISNRYNEEKASISK